MAMLVLGRVNQPRKNSGKGLDSRVDVIVYQPKSSGHFSGVNFPKRSKHVVAEVTSLLTT